MKSQRSAWMHVREKSPVRTSTVNKNQILMTIRKEFDIPYYKISMEKRRGTWHWAGTTGTLLLRSDTQIINMAALSLHEWTDLFRAEYNSMLTHKGIDHNTFVNEHLMPT